jgi:hypothetical protein
MAGNKKETLCKIMPNKKVSINFNPYILPADINELKCFIEKYKTNMTEHAVSSIECAIKERLPLIEVFQFKNSQFVITISSQDFESNLDQFYKFYMDTEQYELCTRVVKLKSMLSSKSKQNNDENEAQKEFG